MNKFRGFNLKALRHCGKPPRPKFSISLVFELGEFHLKEEGKSSFLVHSALKAEALVKDVTGSFLE